MSQIPESLSGEQRRETLTTLGRDRALYALRQMLLIRAFEHRGEAAYREGMVGGFYHSYAGQEAIATAAVLAFGEDSWWTTTYRCHGLALLLGVTPEEAMAELLGRASGNALGRGGSMHLYTDRLLGGHGIVGGGIPVAAGAALASQYLRQGRLSLCFFGDGAVAQGAFHETLNLASLWDLPLICIIENNQWGMGTSVSQALAALPIAERQAPSYNMKGYTVDGTDLLSLLALFDRVNREVRQESRPVLIEAVGHRFKGHSISDPGLYRSKHSLTRCLEQFDPIQRLRDDLIAEGWLGGDETEAMQQEAKQRVAAALEWARQEPWPDPEGLEDGVFAREDARCP